MINLSTFLLGLHLFGAGVTVVLVLGALVSLARQTAQQYLFWLRSIGLAAVFQLLTGVGLVLSALGQTSILTLCARIGIYVLVVCSIETALFYRLKQAERVHA